MFRLLLVVPMTVQLCLQGMTILSKKNLIESVVVKYPYHRGYWILQKDGDRSITYFFKGKDPVFLTNHYLLDF